MKKVIATHQGSRCHRSLQPGIDTGSFVYASGQIPIDPATGNIPEGIEAQSEQAMRNVEAILAEAGLTTDNVVKTTVFLSDMANFAAMNAVYAAHFNEPYPARSAVAVRELPKGVLVEVEVIAVR